MNGDNANIYLTNMKKIDWYNGASIDKERIKEIIRMNVYNITLHK